MATVSALRAPQFDLPKVDLPRMELPNVDPSNIDLGATVSEAAEAVT